MSEVEKNSEGFFYNSWSGKSGEILKPGTHTHGFYDELLEHTLEDQKGEFNLEVLSKEGLNVGIVLAVNWVNIKGTVKEHHSQYGLDGDSIYG